MKVLVNNKFGDIYFMVEQFIGEFDFIFKSNYLDQIFYEVVNIMWMIY